MTISYKIIDFKKLIKLIKLGQVFMCRVMAKDQGILKIKALHKTLSIHT
jgi:hypothetical protein